MKTMSSNGRSLAFRELQYRPDDLALLERFYRDIYVAEFPNRDERESLENMAAYLRLRANGWYGRNNYHIILGFRGGGAVAGSFADYLDEANAGVIEFLVVKPALRGAGFGRQLLDETEGRLAGDAALLGRDGLDVIVAEMNDPYRQNKDSMDGFHRAAIWDRWGYGLLDFPYIQPALSADKARVDGLMLIAKPARGDFQRALPGAKLKAILRGYMRWAMRIDAPDETADYRLMSRYLAAEAVPLTGLLAYTGRDAARPFFIHEVADPAEAEFGEALAVYARAFPSGRTGIRPEDFRAALLERKPDTRYHFWAIRRSQAAPVEGMASFFMFPHAGFGGYIALQGSLQHTRRMPLLLARIEQRMIRDGLGAIGWYIECDPKQEAMFARHGFYTLDLAYAQPPLPGVSPYPPVAAPPLRLMYKSFGRSFAAPQLTAQTFCDTMARVFGTVYGIENVAHSPFYAWLREPVETWSDSRVRFRSAPV